MLNQFCGLHPGGTEFAKELINCYDGCLQCSLYGPDVFPLLPADRDNDDPLWFLMRPPDKKVTPDMPGVPALLVPDKNRRQKSRNKKINAAKANNDELVEQYNRQPQLIVDSSAMLAVALVTNSDGSPIDLAKARLIPVNLFSFFIRFSSFSRDKIMASTLNTDTVATSPFVSSTSISTGFIFVHRKLSSRSLINLFRFFSNAKWNLSSVPSECC